MLSQLYLDLVRGSLRRQLVSRGACFALAIVLLGVSGAFVRGVLAQGNTSGGFRGIVRDQATGNPIPGAKVIFRHQLYGTTVASITDENGVYAKGSLPPGDYDIEVSANGFVPQKKVQTLYAMANYVVEPDPFYLSTLVPTTPAPTDNTNPNAPTAKPTTTSTQSVQTAASVSERTEMNPRRGGIFDRFAVSTLPLGGTTFTRTFDELAFFAPGVNPPPQAIGNSVGPGVGGGVGTSGQFSVNGLRSRANNFTVDGSDNNDEDIGVRRQGFFALVPQPIESIQEFQIITLLAPAEFGRNLGAQVNALSKSGGNVFHGTIYGMLNSEHLNARNFFDNTSGDSTTTLTASRFGTQNPVLVNGVAKTVTNDAGEKDKNLLLQGGFAVGGRIVRDKAFFFASGEGEYLNGTRERNFAVPTVEQRGFLDSGALGLQACQLPDDDSLGGGGACPVAFSRGFPTSIDGDLVFSLFPFANNPTGIYGRNTYTQALSTDARGGILSGRFDWNMFTINGNQQTFTARYNFTKDRRDLTDVGGALFSAIRPIVRTDNFSTFLNGSITNSVSNEFRFSWGRTRLRFDELRDTTGFLQPISNSVISDPEERRFLLNARVIENVTLPTGCTTNGCTAAPQARYSTLNLTTEDTRLGPIGQLNIAGFSPVGVDVFNFPQARTNGTYQFADTVRWQSGQHNIAFGTDIRRVFLDSDLPRNSRPLVTFFGGATSLTDQTIISPQSLAAAGAAGGFFQSIAESGRDAEISLSYTQFDFFVQDEYRVNAQLSFNFGLRYEYNTTPKEANQKIESTFDQQFTGIGLRHLSGLEDFIDGRTKIYDTDRNNFAPRVGFAAALTSDATIRGGYGIYYDQIIGSVVSQSRNVFPTFTTANFGGGLLADNGEVFTLFNPIFGVFDPNLHIVCNVFDAEPSCGTSSIPLLRPGSLNTFNSRLSQTQINQVLEDVWANFPRLNGNTFGATLPVRNLDTPFAHQYWIGFEHRLRFFGNESVLSAAYVGTSGRHLLRYTTPNLGGNLIVAINSVFLNGGNPEISGTTIDPFSNASTLSRPNADIGPINQFETTGKSQYHSLQLGLRGRFWRNFQYQANYVYGGVTDDVSDVFDLAGASALPQNSLTFAGEFAPANFDVRHRFTYDFVYDLPSLKDHSGVVRTLFGGWTLAGTGKFYTGQPFTVNSVFDINLDGNLTDRLDNTRFLTVNDSRLNPLSLTCTSPAQCRTMLAPFGEDGSINRNSFRAGSVLDLDLSISKRFKITENQDIQFRMDAFNFINRANFGVPVRFLEAAGFGSANDTITPAARIQFALKYNF